MEKTEKTLKLIQNFSKVGQVLSKVVFVASIVGASCCAVGFLSLQWFNVFVFGKITIHGLAEWTSETPISNAYAATLCTFIVLMGEIFIANYAAKVFTHELKIGNPFDLTLAKEVRNLGIIIIAVSAGTTVAAGIAYGIIRALTGPLEGYKNDFSIQLGLGLTFIFLSQILKYGALLKESKTDGAPSTAEASPEAPAESANPALPAETVASEDTTN